ncbi:MAG: PaaI family thioesterase [Thiomonas sp.]|nr:PaaI family thioesterase [Thiomonas sp.]
MTTAPAVLCAEKNAAIRQSFSRQGLMQTLGVEIVRLAPGEVVLRLPYSERAAQQQGGFHGGAIGALADVAGGYAAMTLAPEGDEVTTVEYKINFLAAFGDGELRACGRVVRAGKRIIVTTAEVVHRAADGAETPCAVMQQTIAPVRRRY